MFLLLPFDSLIVSLLGLSLTVLFTLLLVFIIVPAVFGVSFGIRKLYMKTLLKIFAWATLRMERGAKEKNHQLYKPYTNGIIAKDPTSLEEEIKEIRRSGSSKALDNTPEFELSDIFYFCRKGMETIMDDEVTKRFSAEELESWNLLSRTNYNFQYISLRLTVLWGSACSSATASSSRSGSLLLSPGLAFWWLARLSWDTCQTGGSRSS